MSDRRPGHTLIELMIVVAIIGVMVANAADLVRGIVAPEARQQRALVHAVDRERLLAQLRVDLDHAADVRLEPDLKILSAFRSRPDVVYRRAKDALVREAGGARTTYPGVPGVRGERIPGAGAVLVKIAVESVVVSRVIFARDGR